MTTMLRNAAVVIRLSILGLAILGAGERLAAPAILPLTPTDIVPHRGGRTNYPENTFYAYSRNLADGTSLDLDIRKTGDGDIVVIHDTTTNRTTESNLTMANSTVAQLQSLDAAYKFDPARNSSFPLRGQGVTIPTLDEVLAEFKANKKPGAFLWIDLKDDIDFTIAQNQILFDRLIELIGEHDLWNEANIEVASTAVGNELKTRDARVQVVFWSNKVDAVTAALNNSHFGRIGVPLSIADRVADAVHASGKKLHVTSGLFTRSVLKGLKSAAPDSLGADDYKTALDSLDLGARVASRALAQQPEANYDETKVPEYTLPEALVMADGEKVLKLSDWQEKRRPEILDLFRTHVYGHVPKGATPKFLEEMTFEVTRMTQDALGGKALRKEVSVYFTGKKEGPKMDLLIHLPAGAKETVPVFLGLNFKGNHSVHPDSTIPFSTSWMRSDNKNKGAVVNHRATESSRGIASDRWPIELILSRGYGLATVYYGDIDPDFDDGFQNGVHPLFFASGQKRPQPSEWGSIAAWAWGLSRAMDYLETDANIDPHRVAVFGHSRLGKTALWAGAEDERFALVISNNSGCGGAALSRRRIGEKVGKINQSFPHWFCENFKRYNEQEETLPVDQHELIALMAPRPVYIASAEQDRWADPRGEYLAAYHAGPVYRLFDKQSLPSKKMPPVNQPLHTTLLGYHIRSGKHGVTQYDWQAYLDFADRHLNRRKSPGQKKLPIVP